MKTLNNKTPTDKQKTQWQWIMLLMRLLRMLAWWQKKKEAPTPSPSPERWRGVATNLMQTDSTPSAAKIANVPASETSGRKSYEPLSKSQLSSWLHSVLKASTPLPLPLSEGEGSGMCGGRKIDLIVLHCSDTRPDQDFTVEKLAACHKARGFGNYPGYHFYVRRDGAIYNTRPLEMKGCHVAGHNQNSIGVCYEGGQTLPSPSLLREGAAKANQSPRRKYGDTRTQAQKESLQFLLAALKTAFPDAKIVGHNELNPKKACPCLSKAAMKEYADLPPALPV